MSTKPSRVAIAGGGIGGIATALALSEHGIASEVYERRAAFPEEGAGIQIGPNGTRILQRLGVAELLESRAATPDALSVREGKTGHELTRLPLGTWIAERHGTPYWTAHRKDLHWALRERAEATPLIELRTGVEIVSFATQNESVRATSSDGEILNASALVCADGLWSNLRNEVASGAGPQPVGKAAFRCVIPADDLVAELTPNAVHIWLAPGAHVVHYPVNAGRDIALIVVADDPLRDPGWDTSASAETVREKVCNFAHPLQALVAKADDWRCWSLYTMSPLDRWSNGRAVLLGDAAHPVLPFLAQGAVLALEDAMMLAASLDDGRNNIESSLRSYELARRPRARRVAEASQQNGRIYHMAGAAGLARNMTMRLAPPARVMAGFDWLYGWRL
ncbi:FAD-binding monooxygenase protein [Hyphomicrobium denitrificans 1NES1]|uniref:FAD-binding monooxygenase protein n=2 Tax=Hyphomicrobium denitrificans TaxID=53399 RepID=N0B6T7_9HYPH|nr:FAD-binding monooxygenase protein [Hyphomicrobium denitrificans 1NES1]